MEILLLYRAISKHYIKIAANDRVNLGTLCNKRKAALLLSCSARHTHIKVYFLSERFCFIEKSEISIKKHTYRKLIILWYLLGIPAIKMYK